MNSYIKFKNPKSDVDSEDINYHETSFMDINVGKKGQNLKRLLKKPSETFRLYFLIAVLAILVIALIFIIIWQSSSSYERCSCGNRGLMKQSLAMNTSNLTTIQEPAKLQNCSNILEVGNKSEQDSPTNGSDICSMCNTKTVYIKEVKWKENVSCVCDSVAEKMNQHSNVSLNLTHLDIDTVSVNCSLETGNYEKIENKSHSVARDDDDQNKKSNSIISKEETNQSDKCTCESTNSSKKEAGNSTINSVDNGIGNNSCALGCAQKVLQNESSVDYVTVFQPENPFLRDIGAMTVGRRVFVSGIAGHKGRFYLGFMDGPDENNIAFNIGVRITFWNRLVESIVFNNKVNGVWQKEMIYTENFPVGPLRLFCVEIKKLTDRFEVKFDNQHHADFIYRNTSGDINRYKYFRVGGTVFLTDVSYTL